MNQFRLMQVKVKAAQSCPAFCDPMDYIVCGILQARILDWVAFPFSRGSSQPRDQTQISRIAGRFFTSWATGKPKNTGVGSLSILQGIFPTQESNRGLLLFRGILLTAEPPGKPSYQGRLMQSAHLFCPAFPRPSICPVDVRRDIRNTRIHHNGANPWELDSCG